MLSCDLTFITYRLDEDINLFSKWMNATDEEIARREEVKNRIFETILSVCGSECKPVVFGSTATGLFSPLSDIDIVVLNLEEGDSRYWVELLGNALLKEEYPMQLKILLEARVSNLDFHYCNLIQRTKFYFSS